MTLHPDRRFALADHFNRVLRGTKSMTRSQFKADAIRAIVLPAGNDGSCSSRQMFEGGTPIAVANPACVRPHSSLFLRMKSPKCTIDTGKPTGGYRQQRC